MFARPAFRYLAPLTSYLLLMLLSMTGFGRVSRTYQDKTVTVEVRALNSKQTDVRLKYPPSYRPLEHELRKLIVERAERGKMDALLEVSSEEGGGDAPINKALFRSYYKQLQELQQQLGVAQADEAGIIQGILRIPNVVGSNTEALTDEEYAFVRETVDQAMTQFTAFRRTEGAVMEADLRLRIKNISAALDEINPHEIERIDKLRQRLKQNLEEFLGKDNVDENRFEQEIIFYLEKIDITEEKVRLAQHLKYFVEQLDNDKTVKGRKLAFITQEIGREINTLGAKAYSSTIQRLVVQMKDELEKIKEQVANAV